MKKRGITLIAVILLMTLLAITIVGLTTFVVERLRLTSTRQNEINAYYMAQAGIYYGIYQYIISKGKGKITEGNSDDYLDKPYIDRGFSWEVTPVGRDNITIRSTGYAPKTGNRIEKKLEASYNKKDEKLIWLGYGS